MDKIIAERSGNTCELCGSTEGLRTYIVAPKIGADVDECVHTCATCYSQLKGDSEVDAAHWKCLSDSMWSEVEAVKVVSYRMLTKLSSEEWAGDLLNMIYMEEETEKWAKALEGIAKHVDSNGVELLAGDNVMVIKDLKVKGAGFTVKRGTSVRNITLVSDNVEHIEAKVEGQRIVILTEYVRK